MRVSFGWGLTPTVGGNVAEHNDLVDADVAGRARDLLAIMPWLLRMGLSFWPALAAGCILTVGLYLLTLWGASRLGLRL